MIPESKAFLDELNELISSNNACNDDIEAKKDMESFLQELNTILNAIEKDEITDEQAADIYEKIIIGQNCTLGLNATKKLKNSLIQFYLI